ncbi:MAG: hypothetical protein AOY29_12770 [Alcanivorax borkumensis]|jgi:hypothetical protein|uniref:FixH family protein n=1 Tax=Alcanivorax borkumensis (strain ATCC 700651 / DSM 11573 / NCIMB 13689 / SK2) TaxID=393595 RepID=Q0VPV4_ALCBS|nr:MULTISPECIES: FixH family protein [Alcanivorax]OJH07719.1 MAG: hypothetical protein AOY29_12770 [Alcanivorax borkumensis]EUC71217.1 hypothetical protein Y017_00140 [Alcanivorax sp. 97CO-5]PKG02650.1 hypothetical protein Y019_00150 [Alcanivorax sp. 97CO-6]CAL16794.1 conserved hypothetical protein [Alcanivorax borkumensis SK2]BAP14269.1 hypothetical protein AS19_14180 [Alcanivorax sp. NBRC 101098]
MNPDSLPRGDELPWYRYPYLWLAILLPAASVVGGLTLLYIAIVNADTPVVDEWYKEGRGINRSVEQERLAARLGVRLELAQVGASVQARLTSETAMPMPEMLHVSLRHPTLPELDVALQLDHQQGALYRGDGALPHQGRRAATVTAPGDHWRLYQTVIIQDGNLTLGKTAAP